MAMPGGKQRFLHSTALSLCEMLTGLSEPGPVGSACCVLPQEQPSLLDLPPLHCYASHRHGFSWRPVGRWPSVGLEKSVAAAHEGWWDAGDGWRGLKQLPCCLLLPPAFTLTQLNDLCDVGKSLPEKNPTKPETPKCWQAFDPTPCLEAKQDWTLPEINGFLTVILAAKTNAF